MSLKSGSRYVSEEALEAFKSKRAEQTILPTVEKQSSASIAILPNSGTPRQLVSMDTHDKVYPTLGIIDLEQGTVGHYRDLRMGAPGQYQDATRHFRRPSGRGVPWHKPGHC